MLLKQDLWKMLACQWQCTNFITVQFEKIHDWQ